MQSRHSQHGLTLIELMIALVVGLIVSGAALALVAALVKSNSETIRATRLTQELRTTSEVIARELHRARSVTDPIANVDSSNQVTTCNTIDTATAGCVKFGYDCTSNTAGTFKTYALVGNSVKVLTSTTGMAGCPTAATGVKISSDAVKISALTFAPALAADTDDTDYTVTLTGTLIYEPDVNNANTLAPVSRKYIQHVHVRSVAVVTPP